MLWVGKSYYSKLFMMVKSKYSAVTLDIKLQSLDDKKQKSKTGGKEV